MDATPGVTRLGSLSIPKSTNSTAPLKTSAQMISSRDRDRGFADPAGADDADKARHGDLPGQLEDVVLPADHAIRRPGRLA